MHAKRIESWMDELCILSKFTIESIAAIEKFPYGIVDTQ